MEPSQNPIIAVGFTLLASALFAGSMLLSKLAGQDVLGEGLNAFQVSHGRFLFGFAAVGLTSLVMRQKIQSPNLKLHFFRGFAGWTGVSLLFAAIAYIPLSDASAISFLNPVFAMILAFLVLKEKVGPWRWGAAAISLTGGLILLQPGADSFQPAAILALVAAMIFGVEITLIKYLSGREGAMQILLLNNFIGLLIASVAVVFVWEPPTLAQWVALAGIGVVMALGQTCFIQALRRGDASFVVPFSYATLLFAGLYDFLIFDTLPDRNSLLGGSIIVAGAALLVWREARIRAPR